MELEIRTAIESDLPALLDIYNHEVLHGISTLDLHPKTMEEWRLWFFSHNRDNHPLLTALAGGIPAGYASLSPYREKEAYKSTAELSVYVAPAFRRMGIARALMDRILEEARLDSRTHLVVSVITSGNDASVRLHRNFGFTYCGTVPEAGMKFGVFQSIDSFYLLV